MRTWEYIKVFWIELWNPDSRAWQYIDRILFILLPVSSLLAGIFKNSKQPEWGDIMTNLVWIIPLSIWLLFILLVVPFRLVNKYYRQAQEVSKTKFNAPIIEYIKPLKEIINNGRRYLLEVKNAGGTGEFTMQIEVEEDTIDMVDHKKGLKYVGYWVLGDHHGEPKIKTGQVDRVSIAELISENSVMEIKLISYDTQTPYSPATSSFRWSVPPKDISKASHKDIATRFSLIEAPPQYILRVVISSTPSLKDGFIIKRYKLDSNTFEEIVAN